MTQVVNAGSWGSVPRPDLSSLFGNSDYSSLSNWAPAADKLATPDIGMLSNINVAPPTAWQSIQQWMNDSGILGKKLADGTQVQGWGSLGLSAANGLMNGWMGMKQYGLAKDQLEQSKRAFNLNYDAQVKTTNAAMEGKAAARYASNPNQYQSPSDYMKQHGIGG